MLPTFNFASPRVNDVKIRLATSPISLIKQRQNLLESKSPVAVIMSPVHSNTVSENVASSVTSSISSTLSTRSEVSKCKEVILKALNLKKNVSLPNFIL